jgi:hypothetical protein
VRGSGRIVEQLIAVIPAASRRRRGRMWHPGRIRLPESGRTMNEAGSQRRPREALSVEAQDGARGPLLVPVGAPE